MFVYVRVTGLTLRHAPDNPDLYEISLELNNHGLSGGGGGGAPAPGVFPTPAPRPFAIVQMSAGLSDRAMDDPITDGDTLIYLGGQRSTMLATPAGYTIGPDGQTVNSDYVATFYKLASGDSQTLTIGTLNQRGVWLELAGEWTPDAHAEATGTSTTPNAGSIVVAPNSVVFFVSGMGASSAGGWDAAASGIHFTTPAGWTELDDGPVFDGHPSVWVAYRYTATGGTFSAAPVVSGEASSWHAQIISFVGTDPVSVPPNPAQWVYDETPSPAPGGGNTTFYTAFPFADGSLKVYVDHVDQTENIVSSDGAAGSFTLAFDPRSWETVLVSYQGI